MSEIGNGTSKSQVIRDLPIACANEQAAVEFLEGKRWGDRPCCAHCSSERVYKMLDAKSGERNRRFLWRCHDCKKQYTVRVGTVLEESKAPLRHWCYALWRSCTSKKGASALEISRQTGLSYKSALFLMHRIRFAMTDTGAIKLHGTIEADETYVGGRPRPGRIGDPPAPVGRGTKKTPVFAAIQRAGEVRARVVPDVTAQNLRAVMDEVVDKDRSRLMTDDFRSYRAIGRTFKGGHEWVKHSYGEYSRGDVHCNTAESFFSLVKRGMYGVYHNVSKKHLHRYVAEFEFRFNRRTMDDGERVVAAIVGSQGKRLLYREPIAKVQ